MYCNYKIYYNDSYVLITCDRSQINKNFSKIIDTPKDIETFLKDPAILFDGQTNIQMAIYCPKPGQSICHFLDYMEVVVAGGGIVSNEAGDLLLIYRRGKWDLPKGKIELKEAIMDGAVREVVEETGVRIEKVTGKPISTFHAYRLKGKNCIKETSWYPMLAKSGQNKLVPQTEEDIEEVRWVKRSDLKNYKALCCRLIWDLLEPYCS